MDPEKTGTHWAGRLLGATLLALGAGSAGFLYRSWKNTLHFGALDALFTAFFWALVVFGLALGATFLPGRLRAVALTMLVLAPWVPPVHKVARHWVYAINVERCRPLSGRSMKECVEAQCQPVPRCVPGGPADKGLCLDTGSPLSSIHCQVKGDGCAPMWSRCAGVDAQHCDRAEENGIQVCQWSGSACVEKVPVCGSCQIIAKTCDALPFEVTWKAPWNER